MKNLFTIILLLAASFNVFSAPKDKDKTFAEEIAGTWKIKNVQKMQGMVIRTKKYTKDGGDSKAFIKRFKGSIVTFNVDGTIVLVHPTGQKTVTGTWELKSDTKYKVNTGSGSSSNTGHTEAVSIMELKFPTARNYNIDGEYADRQFGMVKVEGKFSIIDPKYMFKFERVVEGDEKKGNDKDDEEEEADK